MGTSTYYMKYTHTYVGLPFGNNTRIPLRVRYSHETVRVIARLSLPPRAPWIRRLFEVHRQYTGMIRRTRLPRPVYRG